jgi:hypothetical protein
MKHLRIERYKASQQSTWDDFVASSKNGTFLFSRQYMEYHAERFLDFSLLVYDGDSLIAVLPANRKKEVFISHEGLTYGGVISNLSMTMGTMLRLFDALEDYLRSEGVSKIVYKAIPHIYHSIPAEEDLYALFVNHAFLYRRDVSSTVLLSERMPLGKQTRYEINKAKKGGLRVERGDDYPSFMGIVQEVLETKYHVHPVHTVKEIQFLAEHFPDNIKLFSVYDKERMVGGTIIYESKQVAHAQYMAITQKGKKQGALYLLLDHLLNTVYPQKKYFDFGISTEQAGYSLNKGLISFKEQFGARAISYDFYEMCIK